jgi:hypothetical protein
MKTVATYTYEANARYAESELKNSGIECETRESDAGFELRTEGDVGSTIEILKSMELDESEIDSESVEYIEGYVEWTEKMYDPGHYTGGKMPHYLLDKSNWKFMIPVFALGPILLIFGLVRGAEPDLESLLMMGLYAFVVFSMIKQLRSKTKERNEEKRTHNNRS